MPVPELPCMAAWFFDILAWEIDIFKMVSQSQVILIEEVLGAAYLHKSGWGGKIFLFILFSEEEQVIKLS